MDLQLAGRAYFVSGGSRGIGRAVVEALLEEGARVGTCARSRPGLEGLRADLPPARRDRLALWTCDVRDGQAVRAAVEGTAARFGRLDGVVASAGAGSSGGVLDTSDADWSAQFEGKRLGLLNVVRPALPALRRSDAGRVVAINGVTAARPDPDMAAVSAARAALRQVALLLARELAPDGICVNTVDLGAIETQRQHSRYARSGSALPYGAWAAAEAERRGIPFGRFGRPGEVAPAVLLLLSPLSSYITGATLDVAGGLGAF